MATRPPMTDAQRRLYVADIWPVIQSAPLRSSALLWTSDPIEAEELLSEVAERAARYIHTYRGGSASGWVHSILRSRAIDRYHRRRRERERLVDVAVDRLDAQEPGWAEADIAEAMELREEVACLIDDLEDLDPRHAAVLRLRYGLVAGMPVDSHGLVPLRPIAERLGIPYGTVLSRLYRAHRALRRLLGVPEEVAA